MQCKDVPEIPILEYLLLHKPKWCFWGGFSDRDVGKAMPEDTPYKVIIAKMGSLIRRGLVDGCDCGCRGDFEITEKGEEYLKSKLTCQK